MLCLCQVKVSAEHARTEQQSHTDYIKLLNEALGRCLAYHAVAATSGRQWQGSWHPEVSLWRPPGVPGMTWSPVPAASAKWSHCHLCTEQQALCLEGRKSASLTAQSKEGQLSSLHSEVANPCPVHLTFGIFPTPFVISWSRTTLVDEVLWHRSCGLTSCHMLSCLSSPSPEEKFFTC